MSLKIYTDRYSSTGDYEATIIRLFGAADFTDVTVTRESSSSHYFTISSDKGIYGVNSVRIYLDLTAPRDVYLFKDDTQKALYFNESWGTGNVQPAMGYLRLVYRVIIVDGVLAQTPDNNLLTYEQIDVKKGAVKSTTEASEVLLIPLVDGNGNDLRPFYVSSNLVVHPAGTEVTDGENEFTSTGSLLYFKHD